MMKFISKQKSSLLVFFALFFMIFSPHVSILNYTIKTVYIFVFIPSIFGFLNYVQSNNVPKFINLTNLMMFVSLVYNFIILCLFKFIDTTWLSRILMGFIEFYAAIFIGNIYVNFILKTQ